MSNTITGGIGHWWGLKLSTFAGTPYYLKNGGNNALDGKSDGNAWETMAQINSFTPSVADFIAFKRGAAFATSGLTPPASGVPGAQTVYGSYGAGALPIINGGHWVIPNSGTAGSWTDYTATVANTWYMTPTDGDPLRLEIDGTEYWAATSAATVNATRRWFFGTVGGTSGRLLVYSPGGNPATAGMVLHQAGGYGPLSIVGKSFLTVQDLEFRGGWTGAYIAAATGTPCSYVTLQRLTACRMAGGLIVAAGGSPVQNCDHVTIAECVIDSRASLANIVPFLPEAANHFSIDGLLISGCDHASIHDLVITDWTHCGIYLQDRDGGTVTNADVYNLLITGPSLGYNRGFGVDGSADGKCAYNVLHDFIVRNTGTRNQLNGDHNEVRNFLIDSVVQRQTYPGWEDGEGIQLQGYGGPCHHNTVHHGTISNCSGAGIAIYGSDVTDIHKNVFDDILIQNCGAANAWGNANIAVRIDAGAHVLGNSYTNLRIIAPTPNCISYRGTVMTVPQFNAQNGANGDVISGNTYLGSA